MEHPEGDKSVKVSGRIILKWISLCCSVTTIRNIDESYIRHHQVFNLFTYTCIGPDDDKYVYMLYPYFLLS
jgi:hypothetical protein